MTHCLKSAYCENILFAKVIVTLKLLPLLCMYFLILYLQCNMINMINTLLWWCFIGENTEIQLNSVPEGWHLKTFYQCQRIRTLNIISHYRYLNWNHNEMSLCSNQITKTIITGATPNADNDVEKSDQIYISSRDINWYFTLKIH